ncbi:MAG: hypothetical protein ACNA8G_09100 [Gammaproteobacteria bacterium]
MLLGKILLLEDDMDASLEEAQQEPDPFWRLCANAASLHEDVRWPLFARTLGHR